MFPQIIIPDVSQSSYVFPWHFSDCTQANHDLKGHKHKDNDLNSLAFLAWFYFGIYHLYWKDECRYYY